MDRKTFLLIAVALVLAGLAGWLIKYHSPGALVSSGWSEFPLEKDGWMGTEDVVAQGVIDLLRPDHIFNANYVDAEGFRINLFLGSFSDARGGPHSPMNCLPASGWIVESSESRAIALEQRTIPARRLMLRYKHQTYVMDFWYITPLGETANDYQLKLYQMFGALLFQPRHLTFVRFVARDTDQNRAALDRFEGAFVGDIYARVPVALK